jgi:hypothetical protein
MFFGDVVTTVVVMVRGHVVVVGRRCVMCRSTVVMLAGRVSVLRHSFHS